MSQARYCSADCRRTVQVNPYTSPYTGGLKLPTGTSGAISELRVCCDLLAHGFEVFRAVSPSCSCDLAILRDGRLLRIEVRTGYVHKFSGKQSTNRPKTTGKFDLLAIAYAEKVVYEPSLDTLRPIQTQQAAS